jgi:hypothetical protein
MKRTNITEAVQAMIVKIIATNPAGEGLCLVGGFRYRLLDGSSRRSVDVDYHWGADLEQKQKEIHALLRGKLLPEIRRQPEYDGNVRLVTGPEADSLFVKMVEVALFKADSPHGRIEIPVDITRIPCLDKPIVRTVNGVVYLSASDADMIESKVVALFARPFLAERDLVDIFLFRDKIAPDSPARLRRKVSDLSIAPADMASRLAKLEAGRVAHLRAIEEIIREQVDASAASHIRQAGGPAMVFDQVLSLLEKLLKP